MPEVVVADLKTADDFRRHAKAWRERRKAWAARSAPMPTPKPEPKIIWNPQFSHPLPLKEIVSELLAYEERADELPRESERPTLRRVIYETAVAFGVSTTDIHSGRRHRHVTHARQVAMYLARTLTLWSMPSIGRFIGGRDHTTVLHGTRKITRLLATDEELRATIGELTRKLGGVP